MARKILYIAYFMMLSALPSSCIDDDCSVSHTVNIGIKDKNYFNVSSFPEVSPVNEQLPFRNFSNNIYYLLRNTDTGEITRKSTLTDVTDDNSSYSLHLTDIPEGNYNLSVWGNIVTGIPPGTLHPNGQEHTDIFMASALLKIGSCPSSHALSMERTKGKLLVLCTNFPEGYTHLQANIKHVSQTSDERLVFEGDTEVNKDQLLKNINEILLAPTPTGGSTLVNISFYASETRSAVLPLIIPETKITISRNELTAVRVDYNNQNNTWDISVYADGRWTLIHHLDIS